MAGRAHTHASAAVVSSAAPLMSAAGSSASSSVSFLPVTTDGLPLFDPVTGGGRMLPPAPGDDFDDDPTLANITAASSAFDASTMAGGPRRTPDRPMPANLEGSMEHRGPRRTSAQDQLGFGFEPRQLEGPDQDRINQLDEYRRIQEDCRRLREERDRLADERNRLADERNQEEADRNRAAEERYRIDTDAATARRDANALRIRVDDLQGERQQEEAHLAQVRADALAEEQRIAQARQDWDRERAQTQSSPTGFQLAYVKNPNAYWNVQRPSTRPPSARFVPPFPSVVSVTSAPRQALSSTSQASQDGRVSPAAGAGAANLARPGGGASAAVVPLAANLGAASAVGAMQTSTATTVNRGLAPNSTAATTVTGTLPPLQPSATTGWIDNRRNRVGPTYSTARNLNLPQQTSTAVGPSLSAPHLPSPHSYLQASSAPAAAQVAASLPNSRRNSATEPVDPELQQAIDLSKAEEDLRIAQERAWALQSDVLSRRMAMAAPVQSTSTPASTTNGLNLGNQQLSQFNALAQPFVPAYASTVATAAACDVSVRRTELVATRIHECTRCSASQCSVAASVGGNLGAESTANLGAQSTANLGIWRRHQRPRSGPRSEQERSAGSRPRR